ncbi:MAG: RraA family protein [Betaproteobacteria bacterium]|nr:RraA family protein [Betaproteobacteria bacterium]
MDTLFKHLKGFDTPTIVNALEIVRGGRFATGYSRQRLIACNPKLPPIVGYARTATIRSSTPFDPATRKEKLLAYYEHVAQSPGPTVTVIQEIDHQPGAGAFWGEVNTNVHWGLGCVGAVTNGSMRDLDTMHPQFLCLAATLSPAHAWVHVVDVGQRVDVLGMVVSPNDLVHADLHGSVVFTQAEAEKLPAAIDLMARKEKVMLDAARAPGFNLQRIREAMAAMERVT